MATRRIGESRLDHGAQFFTVRDERFQHAVDEWQRAGLVAPWYTEDGHTRYRATGGMNALAKHLANPFDIRTATKIESIENTTEGWHAVSESGEQFPAASLLLTAPAPQTISLLSACAAQLPESLLTALEAVDYDPCFALLITLDGPCGVPAPGYVRPASSPVEWLADNTQKGISAGPAALTIHATGAFSREFLEAPAEQVQTLLLDAARPWLGASHPTASQLHRWRYSKPVAGGGPVSLFTKTPVPLAIAGDAYAGGRVEGAFLSGLAAAQSLLNL
jgi:predicted NAD/FAD-dependent oxidoreductase